MAAVVLKQEDSKMPGNRNVIRGMDSLTSLTHQWRFSLPSGLETLSHCRLCEILFQNRNENIYIRRVVCHGNQYGIL